MVSNSLGSEGGNRVLYRALCENMKTPIECKYQKPWEGPCGTLTDKKNGYCVEHSREKCWRCKKQATGGCDNAGFFVCGVPECEEHPHMEIHNKQFDEVMNEVDCPRCKGTGKVPGKK